MFLRHDPSPSFLQYAVDSRDEAKQRSPKKARLSDTPAGGMSISTKLSSGTYHDLDQLRRDADHVVQDMDAELRAQVKERGSDRMTVDELKQLRRVHAFGQLVADVVAREQKYEVAHGASVKQEEGARSTEHVYDSRSQNFSTGASVLTLFGNAPNPKQLFSSTQQLLKADKDDLMKSELPVEEMSLPNGLTATKIVPAPPDHRKKAPTFDESFAPPFNLTQMLPPKTQKRSTTRDTTITWEYKDPVARSNKKGGYTIQNLTVGDWLGYGGVDSKDDPSSPREKRKQRDRALSGGESSASEPSKESLAEAAVKEEEALFRMAYSSFAPSCDNSRALVPDQTKNMVWWSKVGEKKYRETFAIDPALTDEHSIIPSEETMAGTQSKDEDFAKAIEDMEDIAEQYPDAEQVHDKTDVDQVLRDVSDLLETLSSHQRIRNSTLASAAVVSRTPMSPSPALSYRIARPDSPADDEWSTYRNLRRELTYLLLKLPPYAVAKLNGDQLEDLGVGKLVTFDGKDVKGSMEDDQVARLAKHTAMATAAGIATLTRPGSSNSQHYSSTNQRTPAIGQAANTRYGSSAQFGASRTPGQPSYHRSISSQPMYGTPSATAPRSGYGQQPNQYSRPGQQSYGQSSTQQYYRASQTPGGYPNYQNNSTPQTNQRPAYSTSQPLAQYQQRAINAASYQSRQQDRSASPLKSAGLQMGAQQQPPQAQHATTNQQQESGRGTPVNYPSQPATPHNSIGYQARPPPQVAPREASGTPQPIAPHPPPAQPGQQVSQANGHG